MTKLPTIAWACITVAFLGLLAAVTVLSVTGADSAEFYRFLNVASNLAMLILGGGATALAGKAAQQTNGGLDKRIEDGAKRALEQQQRENP